MYENSAPILTAIMPVYNGEEILRETLTHLLQIQYQAFELILIDDGSSDHSGAICRQYEALDKRIHYIRQENQGIAATRNRGLDLARGKYICFWDQDDIVIEEGYFGLLNKMQKEHAQMGMCSTSQLIRGSISNCETIQDSVCTGEKIQKEFLYPLLFRGYQYPFINLGNYIYGSVWKCIFRLDFITDNHIRFQKFINYEDDWIFVTQALCCVQKVVTTSKTGYCWRVNEHSESHKKIYIENLQKKFAALDEYIFHYLEKSIKNKNILDQYQKINLCEHYTALYRNAANVQTKDKGECRKSITEYLYNTNYKKQLSCKKHLRKSAYRKRIILNSLQYGGISATYAISRAYDFFEDWMSRIPWILNIERKNKLKQE